MNRSEFLHFLLCILWTRYNFKPGQPIKDIQKYITDFINDFFMESYRNSEIKKHRFTMRDSSTLNTLLLSNKNLLINLYEEMKEKGGGRFLIGSAHEFFLKRIETEFYK